MSKRLIVAMIVFIFVCGFMIGCGKKEDSNAQPNNSGTQNPPAEQPKQQPAPPAEQPKPADNVYKGGKVELTLFDTATRLTDDEFEEYYVKLLKAKYPDITVTKLKGSLNELLSSGTVPDLVTIANTVIHDYLAADYPQDLNEMVKKYNIDTSVFVKEAIVALRDFSKDGALLGLPFGDNSSALVYNQEIFDKFGMEFPKRIITLEEYADLVKRLTRKEGDIQYIGGNIHETNVMVTSGLNYTDPNDKNKALFSTDKHKYVFGLFQQIYQIPNYISTEGKYRHGAGLFWKDQVMAMNWTWVDNTINDVTNAKPTFNWNIYAVPVIWKDNPSRNALDFHLLMVSKMSKNKEAAYAVVAHILSKETQIIQNRRARLSSHTDPEIRKDYAKESGIFDGKDIASVFQIGPTPLWEFTEHINELGGAMQETARQLALEGTDLNTAIRIGEELANQAIKEKLAKK